MSTGTEKSVAPDGAPVPPASLASGEADAVLCTSCGEANAVGSRFCRSCGASFVATEAAQVPEAPIAAAAAAPGEAASTLSAAPSEDAKRARQLLDKAFTLFERGDMANAIQSCRQSVALAPASPQGFSMLGLLLERSGDLEEAAAAYARVLRLAPGSRQESESLERIRATISQRKGQAPAFHFNERELDEALAGAAVAPTTAVARDVAGMVRHMAPAPDDYSNTAHPSAAGLASPSISALHFDASDAEPEPWWKKLAEKPTAFSRGLPLASVAGLSLLFLIWARGSALSRFPQDSQLPASMDSSPISTGEVPPLPASDPAEGVPATPPLGNPAVSAPTQDLPQANARNGAYPVSNSPGAPPQALGSAPGRPTTAGQATRPVQNPGSRASQSLPNPVRPQPVFPTTRVVPPAYPGSLPPVLPVPAQPSAPSISLPSQDGNLISAGGGPLGPNSSSRNQGITLTRPRQPSVAVVRPSSRRVEDENVASRAVGAGRPDVAIGILNRNIRNGGETGWTYQQRALAFVERGDYQRAADDFQTAISAYRDQIARGERVEEARAGVSASQSGLNLALQSLRR